ncbi:MAG: ATP-binding protein, partial [Firmicutes bacterium]|nr:ATP-binding protein [Bacillota bacterium]
MQYINQMKLEFLSIPANVAFARVTVAAFASQMDFTLADLEEIKVAVSEAVGNSIIHGYDNAPDRMVRVYA